MKASNFSFLHIYSSHMVLQRRKPVVFQGTAEAGSEVTLTFDGKSATAVADSEGYWLASFPALEAGGPHLVTLTGAPEKAPVTLEDVMVGEVWICTGQSNMEMPVWSTNPFWQTKNADEEVRNADHPQLRLYELLPSGVSAHRELRDLTQGSWQVCSPESVKAFSACGYFFGRQLQSDLDIPVGLINVSWGGTFIEAWISQRKLAEYRWPAPKDDNFDPATAWENLTNSEDFSRLKEWLVRFDAFGAIPEKEMAPEFDDSGWDDLGDRIVEHLGREAVRLSFDLDPRFAGCAAKLSMSCINDVDHTFCNGKFIGETSVDTPNYWDAPRHYEIPDGVLRAGKNTITVCVDNHFQLGLVPESLLTLEIAGETQMIYTAAKRRSVFLLPKDFPERPAVPIIMARHDSTPAYPSTLFNARVAPWKRFPMRGTIWYQGCNNNGELSYYPLHKMLIDDWREQFNDPDFTFLLVQLAAYHSQRPEKPYSEAELAEFAIPEYCPYAVTREIQSEMPRRRPGVGMITAFDCGEASDIHPRDKQTLGLRLARKAEAMCYQKPCACDSPEFDHCRMEEGGKIRLFFRHTGSGLTTRDGLPPKGFRIGNAAGDLKNAKAVIEGDTVVVWADSVPYPQRVRYAFAGYAAVNLYSKEGLPVLPFRTDKPDYEAIFSDVR